jgi:hypothetical protein
VNRKLVVGIAALVLAGGGVAVAGPASAAGLNGASYCSGSSAPDGDVSEPNNAGEVISFYAPQGEYASGGYVVGQVVKLTCNPNLSPVP